MIEAYQRASFDPMPGERDLTINTVIDMLLRDEITKPDCRGVAAWLRLVSMQYEEATRLLRLPPSKIVPAPHRRGVRYDQHHPQGGKPK